MVKAGKVYGGANISLASDVKFAIMKITLSKLEQKSIDGYFIEKKLMVKYSCHFSRLKCFSQSVLFFRELSLVIGLSRLMYSILFGP